MLDHKPRLKCIYQYANYLVIWVRIDCTHSRSWVPYFTGCSSSRPDGGGEWPSVGPSSMPSSRYWTNFGPVGIAVWSVTGCWPRAVCELLSLIGALRDNLVQIVPKAPNLAQVLPMPYCFDFRRLPRQATDGAAILAKSNMAAIGGKDEF